MKINDAKSLNVGKGSLCHNCHLRAGHTARNCTLERCQTVYSCGQDKFHPGEVAKRRELEQSIHKLEKEKAQLSSEMQNRKTSKKCKIRFHIKLNKHFWKRAKKRIRKMVIEIGSVFESMYTRYRATAKKTFKRKTTAKT